MSKFVLIALIASFLAGLRSPVDASGLPRAARKTQSGYRQMKPFEDLSLQEDPLDIYDKAVTAFGNQRYDEAEKLFKKVLALNPKNADAKYNLGAIAEWHNNLNRALSYYKEALQLKPGDGDFQKAVLDVQLKQQIDAQAKENKRQENLVEAGQRAKLAFASGDYYEAARQLNQLSRVFPNEPKVHYALGQSLRALKAYEWAAYHLKMAIYLDPVDETYHKALIDLDQEIELAQNQAISDSAQLAMIHVRPFSGGELTESLSFGGDLK